MYSAKSVVFDKALKIIKVIKNKQYDIMNIQVQAQVILNQHRVNSQAVFLDPLHDISLLSLN